eukprot:scaffold16964_cov36-Phaeocystis_antarctica.AAC.1
MPDEQVGAGGKQKRTAPDPDERGAHGCRRHRDFTHQVPWRTLRQELSRRPLQPRSSHAQQAVAPPADALPRAGPRSSSASTEGCGLLDSNSKMASCRWACRLQACEYRTLWIALTVAPQPAWRSERSDSPLERATFNKLPGRGFEQHAHPGRGAGRGTDHAGHQRRRRASKRRAERPGAPEEEGAVCDQCDAAGASEGGRPQTNAA